MIIGGLRVKRAATLQYILHTHSVVEAINVYTLSSSQVKELAAALS